MRYGYYRHPVRKSGPMTIPSKMFPISTVFAAAVAAQRINGEYVKWGSASAVGGNQETSKPLNSQLMRTLLAKPTDLIKEDFEQGEAIRLHYSGMLTQIFDDTANEFTKKVIAITQLVELGDRDPNFGLTACLPSCYERDVKRQIVQNTKIDAESASSPLPGVIVGAKVALQITVISCSFSVKYNVNVINATSGTHLLFFFNRNGWNPGQIYQVTGKVKRFTGNTTQLNFVKLAK